VAAQGRIDVSKRSDRVMMTFGHALPLEGTDPWKTAAAGLLKLSGCEIVNYRTSMRGVAWTKHRSGRWWIAVPRPKSWTSYAVFAHEVGHQMLHRGNGKYPRWREEIEAWRWALDHWGDLPHYAKAHEHARSCIGYTMWKGIRTQKDPVRAAALFEEMLAYTRVHDLVPTDEPRGWLPYITRRIELLEVHHG
jgi:hypothetical protein